MSGRWRWWPVVCVALLMVMPRPTAAHGGGVPFLVNEPLGEFVASVWLNPSPLETGEVHITVGLAKDESVVLNQQIVVRLYSPSGDVIAAPATHENAANRFLYEADMVVDEPGEYQIEVEVAGQNGRLMADVVVRAASWTRSPWVGLAALAVVAVIWFVSRGDESEVSPRRKVEGTT